VLDEPTNDLDIESLELLEATLQAYGGTLVVVSHDRAFLDNVATQTLVAEGHGVWLEYAGGYADWLSQRRVTENAATTPKAAASRARALPQRVRLTFSEARELDALPAELEALEREQHELSARMCAPDYHRQEVERIKADRMRTVEIERLLGERYARWGELDAKATTAAQRSPAG
jgi:ATPase components of ABC transporters with duplicated ATPase domains